MAWNSSMNTKETIKKLTDKDKDTGDYKIPKIIYSDAYYSETVPYADLVLPDTTFLERWDCISLLDRPISSADSANPCFKLKNADNCSLVLLLSRQSLQPGHFLFL